jgi:hypothetical protein
MARTQPVPVERPAPGGQQVRWERRARGLILFAAGATTRAEPVPPPPPPPPSPQPRSASAALPATPRLLAERPAAAAGEVRHGYYYPSAPHCLVGSGAGGWPLSPCSAMRALRNVPSTAGAVIAGSAGPRWHQRQPQQSAQPHPAQRPLSRANNRAHLQDLQRRGPGAPCHGASVAPESDTHQRQHRPPAAPPAARERSASGPGRIHAPPRSRRRTAAAGLA